MNSKLIPIALIIAAPLAVACGAAEGMPHEDFDSEVAALDAEQDALDAELGSNTQALRAQEVDLAATDVRLARDLELPSADELRLPAGVSARVRRTGDASAEIVLNGSFDPGEGGGGYAALGWGDVVDYVVGKLLDKLSGGGGGGGKGGVKCTSTTTTTTTPDGTITTTVTTSCQPA